LEGEAALKHPGGVVEEMLFVLEPELHDGSGCE
jgi:hypothetical protein